VPSVRTVVVQVQEVAMSEYAAGLPAIRLGQVTEGDRIRVGVGFDLRGHETAGVGRATLWLDLGPLTELPTLRLLDPATGSEYHARTGGRRAGRLVGLPLGASALADLRDSSGGFFTLEGEFRLAGHPSSLAFTPRFCQLSFDAREEAIPFAA
jgi:hypothetical protein